jgi:hypothetical protein
MLRHLSAAWKCALTAGSTRAGVAKAMDIVAAGILDRLSVDWTAMMARRTARWWFLVPIH